MIAAKQSYRTDRNMQTNRARLTLTYITTKPQSNEKNKRDTQSFQADRSKETSIPLITHVQINPSPRKACPGVKPHTTDNHASQQPDPTSLTIHKNRNLRKGFHNHNEQQSSDNTEP